MRKRETTAILENIGIAGEDLYFLGKSSGIPDGKLVEHLDVALDATLELLSYFKEEISLIYGMGRWSSRSRRRSSRRAYAFKKIGVN